jgi:hypothetical protein
MGDVVFSNKSENGLLGIKDVTYVPNLTANLISVSTLCKSKFVTVFDCNGCSIYDPRSVNVTAKPLINAKETNGVYKLSPDMEQ